MNEQKNNGKGIFYGVIGVATLIVAIIGATFAYFTATETAGENVITGNAATISFGLTVQKVTTVDDDKGGMIPMTDGMIEAAVTKTDATACLDDNGNAVCQIYSITVENKGTASMFLDGYVNLAGGLDATGRVATGTNMRWVQVFRNSDDNGYAVTGTHKLAGDANSTTSKTITFADFDQSTITTLTQQQTLNTAASGNGYVFNDNSYDYIANNYMRVSLANKPENGWTRANTESALVYNQYIAPQGIANDSIVLYFAVWLTETGTDQTPDLPEGATAGTTEDPGYKFFSGVVEFNSAAGGEVSATFGGYTRKTA